MSNEKVNKTKVIQFSKIDMPTNDTYKKLYDLFMDPVFNDVFSVNEEKKYIYHIDGNTRELFIKILENNEAEMFGICSVDKNINDVLTKLVDKKTKTPLDNNDYYFKYISFFYIDFKKSILAFIKSQSIPEFNNVLITIIREKVLPLCLDLIILPILVENIRSEIKKINRASVKMAVSDSRPFQWLIKEDFIKDISSVKLQFKINRLSKNIDKLYELIEKKELTSIQVSSSTANNYMVYDLIENTICRKSNISLTHEIVKNNDIIKKNLINSINALNLPAIY